MTQSNDAKPTHAPTPAEVLAELLQAALDTWEEGVAVLGADAHVVFWSAAAAAITGYHQADMLSRPCPPKLYEPAPHHGIQLAHPATPGAPERPMLVNLHHHQGHTLPAMLRRMPLRDATGARFGTLLRFHPTEDVDTLPHGQSGEGIGVENSQADLEDRLDDAYCEWTTNSVPFGVLWITIDQSAMMRKTHGRDACEAMLAILERTLVHGLRPTEILGRWGNDEFLVVSHERSAEMLDAHAHHLAGQARTADFRWWGDRLSLTVSIGAAQAAEGVVLSALLKRAQTAMEASKYAGGNHVTSDGRTSSGTRG